jgi:LacI family transcriptional regulator
MWLLLIRKLTSLPMGNIEPPTAVFVGSGNLAIGVLRAFNHLKLMMPEDISLVVFDDLEWAEAYCPPVTAIAQKTTQIGSTATELLLVIRESTISIN